MPKILKVLFAVLAAVVIMIAVAVILAPALIDLNTYKPRIEERLSSALGVPVKLAGPIKPSLFPWIGAALSDIHIENPPGFPKEDLASVDSFEARVRLLPLLKREVEISRFVIKAPKATLIKNKAGRGNWEALVKSREGPGKAPQAGKEPGKGGEPPIKSLVIDEFAISDGQLIYIDQSADSRQVFNQMNLRLEDIALTKPVEMTFSAMVDTKPLTIVGTVGPLGAAPGKAPIPLDLTLKAIDQIEAHVQGRLENRAAVWHYSLTATVEPFSPRQLFDNLKQPLPLQPADPQVLSRLEAALKINGNTAFVEITEGKLGLDDSRFSFSGRISDFEKPALRMDAAVDRIDLDRYLPPPDGQVQPNGPGPAEHESKDPVSTRPADVTGLRSLVLDSRFQADEVKIKNARLLNIQMHVTARNGIISLDPFVSELYSGRLAVTAKLDVQGKQPRSTVKVDLGSVQAGPLQVDMLKKEYIGGVLAAGLDLRFSGDESQIIRRTLDGSGKLAFTDGALSGIDLAGMVRNIGSAFGLAENPAHKPKTDFTELLVPLTIEKGVVKIAQAQMLSPLLRVQAQGTTDLVSEKLDLRIEPKFVATLAGQGDTRQLSGIMVPVIVEGSLSDPSFRPDLQHMIRQQLPDQQALERRAQEEIDQAKQKVQSDLEEKARDVFRGLPFGGPPARKPGN